MSVTRVGATKQYSDNWENIFGGKRRVSGKKTAARSPSVSAKRKPSKKKSPAKSAKRARQGK